jgi:hypothetical protein
MWSAQSDTDAEGKGRALMTLGGSLTEIDLQRSSGNYLQAFSSVEDVRVVFSHPLIA